MKSSYSSGYCVALLDVKQGSFPRPGIKILYKKYFFDDFLTVDYIHTYIIGHYDPSVSITAELLTPLML